MIIHGDAVPRFAKAANEGTTVEVLGLPCRVILRSTSTWTENGETAQVAQVELIPQAWPYIAE
ncbi:hypothetical protein [Massilia sp. METH4]|uniref:hypothetical protein n=1 Tax=Massilia sp. METH4 TaxID=3123041 RepID=UPI0030CD786A